MILPITLFLSLLIVSLLLSTSEKLIAQSYTHLYREDYQHQLLLEKSLIQTLIKEIAAPDFFSSTHHSKQLKLTTNTTAVLSYSPTLDQKQEVRYAIYVPNGIIRGGVVYDKLNQTYTLN